MSEFLWGVATSGHQIDGNNFHSDWWHWEQDGNVEGGAISGRACDHWNRYREDLDLAAGLGLNSYRFSIEWARIEPEQGKWDGNTLEWYESLIAECEKRKLLPMVTLHHFTCPKWFADRGGFSHEEAPTLFAGYVKQVVSRLGARIPLWCTFNEPNTLVVGQYLGSYMPPGKVAPHLASRACRNLLRAHVRAYEIIHGRIANRKGPWCHYPLSVGFAHNMIDFVPLRKWHPVDRISAGVFHRFYNKSWLDAVTGRRQHFGVLGVIPYAAEVPQARGRVTVDFIGVNYYMRLYVGCRPYFSNELGGGSFFPAKSSLPVGVIFTKGNAPVSDLGWAIHPKGLGRLIRFVRQYHRPIYVTENGVADEKDSLRPHYLLAHLKVIAEEISRGADILGYYHWSLMDNFEWIKGFGPRFGLFEVNYDTLERRERPSAKIYRHLIDQHRKQSFNGWSQG